MRKTLHFTKSGLKSITPPTTGRLEIYDDHTPALMVRVTPAGTKTFTAYRRIPGKGPQRVRLGRFPDMSIERARSAARVAVDQMAGGIDPVAVKRAACARSKTLQEVFEDYLVVRDLKAGTVTDYRRVMKEAFDDWKNRPLRYITKDKVSRRHRQLGERSPARANNAMRVLRALFNYAAATYEDDNGEPLIKDNPVSRLSTARAWYRVGRRQTVIKDHEIPAWFTAVAELEAERTNSGASAARDFLLFLLFTGLRRGEAVRLTWADVDLQARAFTIEDTKNRQPHTLPLSSYLQLMLRHRIAEVPKGKDMARCPVFATPDGEPITDLRYWVNKVAVTSGVPFTPHDLRRTFITVAESLDIPTYALKRLLNHKMTADVTAGYIVADVGRLRRPMQKITDQLLRLAKVKDSAKVVPMKKVAS